MGKITNIFRQMFSMDENLNRDTLTNQRVLDEMLELFSQQIRHNSAGKTMIFPMTFILYVHPADYDNLKGFFPIFFPEIVDGFYNIIKNNRKRYPVIGAHATEWNVYILPSLTENVTFNDMEVKIQKGELTILCSLFDAIANKSSGGNQKIGFSVRIKGSVCLNDININLNCFRGVEVLGEGHFRIQWKEPVKSFSEDNVMADDSLAKVLAILICTLPDGKKLSYEMHDTKCLVSGINDKRNEASIFKIPSDIMGIPHVEIRYVGNTDQFEIAAYVVAKVDDAFLPLSKPNDMHWSPLRHGAKIGLTKKIFLTFNRNK